jgi:transcriptional regulator with XRE-family HTH domain
MIGTHLLYMRTAAHGYTLKELSALTGLSVAYLSDLERGRSEPSLKTLCAIAKAYGVGAGDLLVEAGYTTAHDPEDARMRLAQTIARDALEHALKVVSDL